MPAGNASILKEQYGFDAAAAREELIRLAGRFHGKRVLDVGTGCGSLAVVLAQHGFAVTTIDINADSLNCIRERTDHLSRKTVDRIRFVKADALRLPFRSQTFDGVFSFDSLHHMPDCPATVAEMLRVLTPGGVLAVADLNEIGAQAVADVIAPRGVALSQRVRRGRGRRDSAPQQSRLSPASPGIRDGVRRPLPRNKEPRPWLR